MRIGRSFHSCKQLFPPDHYVLPHCSENLPGQPVAAACCTCLLLSSGAGCQPELPSLKQAGRGLHSHTHHSESGRQLALERHGAPIINMFRLFEKRSQQLTQSLPIIFCTIIQAKGMATAKRRKHFCFSGTENSDRAKEKGYKASNCSCLSSDSEEFAWS